MGLKVYDIQKSNGEPLEAVVRVASPAFPRDKLESEVCGLWLHYTTR